MKWIRDVGSAKFAENNEFLGTLNGKIEIERKKTRQNAEQKQTSDFMWKQILSL